jgi:hypothetical protein
MKENSITFEKLAWAAFIARYLGNTGPEAYMPIYRDKEFRKSLVYRPESVSPEEVCNKLIAGFLNKWRSRFRNSQESASAILAGLQEASPYIQATIELEIGTAIFENLIIVNGNHISVFDAIELVFNKVANCYGNHTTVGAKILGILNPNLFVMWDAAIALHYLFDHPCALTGNGYAYFLKEMKKASIRCQNDFDSKFGHQDMALYVSNKLGLNPPLTTAKYLDEYNWITITQRITLPPKWHPGI